MTHHLVFEPVLTYRYLNTYQQTLVQLLVHFDEEHDYENDVYKKSFIFIIFMKGSNGNPLVARASMGPLNAPAPQQIRRSISGDIYNKLMKSN